MPVHSIARMVLPHFFQETISNKKEDCIQGTYLTTARSRCYNRFGDKQTINSTRYKTTDPLSSSRRSVTPEHFESKKVRAFHAVIVSN